jgi:hypothetical protein
MSAESGYTKSKIRRSAVRDTAVIRQTRIPSEWITAPGHEQSFEKTNRHSECASFVKVIVSIEDPVVIQKILAHLDGNAISAATGLLPGCRSPPSLPMGLFV